MGDKDSLASAPARRPIGRVRYAGDYYKVMFVRGEIYDLLAIEGAPFGEGYRVWSPYFEDDGVFPKSEFEVVELYERAAPREPCDT